MPDLGRDMGRPIHESELPRMADGAVRPQVTTVELIRPVTATPTLRLERFAQGPVYVHGWIVTDDHRSCVSLPPAAFAALESALDGSWADTILEQRDAAIAERDALRLALARHDDFIAACNRAIGVLETTQDGASC